MSGPPLLGSGEPEVIPISSWLHSIGAATLGDDPSLEAIQAVLQRAADLYLELEQGDRALFRDALIQRLKGKVNAPATIVGSYLQNAGRPGTPEEDVAPDPEELLRAASEILEADDQLAMFRSSVRRVGYAGSAAAAEILHVALNSRSLARPINVGVHGPSAGGKTFTVDVVLQHHPDDVAHDLTASSERALAYSDFKSEHAYVVVAESSGLHRDGVGATIIRSLAWGDGIKYETVEKTDQGLQARIIEKPGPTGLITTSTKPLDPEISTRLLSIHITDSSVQTAAIVETQAKEAAGHGEPDVDLTAWQAASKWLEVRGDRETVVPFAPALGERVPYDDVRMRRDFEQILTVVRTIAFMHQRCRDRDDDGRIIANRDDYAAAYRLLAKVMAVTLDTVTDEMRETVAAVERLTEIHAGGVSVTALADALEMSKSGASRRAKAARREGYLINIEDRKGYPLRLKVGDPLPADRPVLPRPEELFAEYPPETAATAQRTSQITSNGAGKEVLREVLIA